MLCMLLLLLLVCPTAYGMVQSQDAGKIVGVHTPLVQAALESNLDLVTMLLDVGADVNEIAPSGLFPLYAVVHAPLVWDKGVYPTLYKRFAVIKLLLSRGADFEMRTSDAVGDTVFHASTKLAYGGERKILLQALMITHIMSSIFRTQGPLAKAFKEQPHVMIPEKESIDFKDKVRKALLIKNKAGKTTLDLICNKGCYAGNHHTCFAMGYNESLVSVAYDSVLGDLKSQNS